MTHVDIYEKFKEMFPEQSFFIDEWFPNGKNSIRVRMKDGSDFIFTYTNPFDWCYETVESFIKTKMKGGRTMNVGLHENSDKN